ncbi:MAG: glutamate 5-kinase [Rhodothermales bacterium]
MARIVVKIGTSVLTGGGPVLDREHIGTLARQCAALHAEGHEIIICSSGAITAGRGRMGLEHVPAGLPERQMLAAVGQSRLMRVWEEAFDPLSIVVGQVLLTRADVEDRNRYLNGRDAIQTMIDNRVIPVVNENDAVATAEIRVGDNDNLSALLCLLVEADLLLMLTDQPGLFTADPRLDPNAELLSDIAEIDDAVRATATGTATGLGTGGMATKLQAAEIARRAGTAVVIASGHRPDVIVLAAHGVAVGTRFAPAGSTLEHRKRWILAGSVPQGSVEIDTGAASALTRDGRSLLPAGITAVNGPFLRGDSVSILGMGKTVIARGIVRYDSEELAQIQGLRSADVPRKLGYTRGAAAIHRNDLVLA